MSIQPVSAGTSVGVEVMVGVNGWQGYPQLTIPAKPSPSANPFDTKTKVKQPDGLLNEACGPMPVGFVVLLKAPSNGAVASVPS